MEDCQFTMMKKIFFGIRGIVHYKFVTTGQRVNQVYYLEVLEKAA